MHIKKLEICGFKSFVDRTVIHFDHDMIGVVGPNGCGKSNVVDAIRWALGEQSAKALRGKAMGDVIFSGSESRVQAGFAEVTITFDNADPAMAQQLPLEYRDYQELAVTRRLYRGDGENEYFINKTPVRLRDVTDVFLGTGVGRKAYSIVEQGKIGLIVSARAEDRRVLIEEAAGITKYKARKRQAESKMLLTRQNLTRVGDIVAEIERQLGSLRRQAAKAKRYVRYREELDDLLLWDASHRLLELVVRIDVASASKRDLGERVESERAAVDARDAAIEVLRQEMHEAERAAERTQNAAFHSDNEVREHEARIERASDRYQHLVTRLEQARIEQHELERKAVGLDEEAGLLRARLDDADRAERDERAEVDAAIALLTSYSRESEAARVELGGLRRAEAEAGAAIARAEAELQGSERRRVELAERHQRMAGELERLVQDRARLSDERDALASRARELVNRKQAMCDARDALARELPGLRHALESQGKVLDRERGELHARSSRLRALEEVAQRMEGVGAGVRNLLRTEDAALGGLVADRIEVPAELTAAFAGLVGDRLQCVVVHDLDRALELLRSLATDGAGRATVIPDRPASRPPAPCPVGVDGVRGLIIDHIGFAPDDHALVRALVGDALLVESAEHARQLHAMELDCDVVTLDGIVFHADGRVTGGAGDAFAASILERKREIRELSSEVAELSERVDRDETALAELRQRLTGMQQALDEAKSEAHEAEIAMVTGQQDLSRLEQQLSLVGARHDEVAAELGELERAAVARRAEEEQTRATLSQMVMRRAEALERIEGAEQRAHESQERVAHQQQLVTERKVQLASVSERAASCRAALDRLERELAELTSRIQALETERERAAQEAGELAATLVRERGALLTARSGARAAQAAFESARVELDDARHSLGLRESELREMRSSLDALQSQLSERAMELSRLEMALEHLEENVRDRFRGLELRRVVGDYHARALVTEEHKARIKELTQLIDRMGSVNLDAMKEFEESSERFEFYTRQKADLEQALGDLEKAIAQMNKESRRLFKHAFEGINRRFIEIFPKLFRGGKAELRLTDPNDLLETGIEILAQPPGKRLSNIELMSGGEKAFTAVALLLSIFRYKPSPFCVLDEVDAPLDDANIDRYVEAIRAMTDRSQFILITHSKRTMQAVDVLYGVTMQEPGVSKLVGVRVGNGATRSENRRISTPPRGRHIATSADNDAEAPASDDTAVA